jgi:Secretion system C-terminal sorting domain/Fibronectin type III domain
MKKLLLSLLFAVSFVNYAQQYVSVISSTATSPNSRAPQGTQRYIRTCYVISPAEITASGLPNSSVLNAISFEYSIAQSEATTGTLKVYLQNTTDATYLKTSTTWTDVINGMTLVHDASSTIPAATGFWNIPFSGGSPFTYTGSGMYVAFEYENASGAVAATANNALCSTSITGGLRNAFSTTAMPTVLGATASNWRPNTRFAFPATCILPTNVSANSVTATSANISFIAPTVAPASGYEYLLSTTLTTPTASTPATGTSTTTTISLNSLSPTTTYYVWVRSVCSAMDKSVWSLQPFVFHTATVVPYSTGFEVPAGQSLFVNQGWANQATGNTGNWLLYADTTTPPFNADAGINFIGSAIFTDAAMNAYMFSRPIVMTGGVLHQITYKYRVLSTATTTVPMAFRVVTNTTNTATGVNVLTTKTGVNNLTYISETLDFTPTTTGTYYVGFHNNTPTATGATTNNFIFIDTFSVTAQLSNDKFDSNSISIFPNPATDILNINGVEGITSLVINDINGRTIKTVSNATSINISDLNAGVYFVNITTENGNVTKKFMKN